MVNVANPSVGSELLRQHLADIAAAVAECESTCGADVAAAADIIIASYRSGGKLLICGNGGSAADSLHMAAELVSSYQRGLSRKALPAIALPANTATITAYSNDFDPRDVFVRQVEAFGVKGDVLLAISTSGRSENVIRAARAAQDRGLSIIGLTRAGTTPLSASADVSIGVPGTDTQVIQTLHLAVEHTLCGYVEAAFDA